MLHISILSGTHNYFTLIIRAATFQYFGVPCLFRVVLWSSQSRFLPIRGLALSSILRKMIFLQILWIFFQLIHILSGYFSQPTRMSPIAGSQYLLEHHMHMLELFESTQYYINQLEFDYKIGLSVCLCRDLKHWPLGLQITKH